MFDASVNFWEHADYAIAKTFIIWKHLIWSKELLWYCFQSLFWPIIKPIKSAAIDQWREVAASITK